MPGCKRLREPPPRSPERGLLWAPQRETPRPGSPGEGVWDAPLPAAAAALRPLPSKATRGKVVAGLSHSAEGRPGSVAAGAADKALSSPSRRRPVAAGHLAGLRGYHVSRRPSIAAATAAPNDAAAAAAAAAAAVSAAGKRPHPFLPVSRGVVVEVGGGIQERC